MDYYLIWSYEHRAWWGPGRCGYTARVSKAGRYTRSEALDICTGAMPGTSTKLGALPELPVRLPDVDEMVRRYRLEYGDRPEEPWA